MDAYDSSSLRRTPSRTSTASASSQSATSRTRAGTRKSGTPHPRSSSDVEDKSLTSFPSLSPDGSPQVPRHAALAAAAAATPPPGRAAADTPATARRRHRPSNVDTLTQPPPARGGPRSALFDESPTGAEVPGALHALDDAAVRRVVARTGAVRLVRQLAEDLARRDAEAAAAARRADARERELRRMLREVEVSALDIERRLRRLDAVEDPLRHERGGEQVAGAGLGKLMQEALRDEMGGAGDDGAGGYLDERGDEAEDDKEATIKARAKDKAGGWTSMLWNGGTSRHSRANSTATDSVHDGESSADRRRRAVADSTFRPPPTPTDGQDSEGGAARAEQRAASLSAWTMNLFTGKPQGKAGRPGARGRSDQESQSSTRDASQASGKTSSSAQAALLRVKESNPAMRDAAAARRKSTPLLPTATAKSSAAQSAQGQPPGSPASTAASGPPPPVEMDAILPAGTRPPTLNPQAAKADDPSEPLTDRFGFIYDQRRRKKEAEAFARMGGAAVKAKQEMLSTSKDSGDGENYLDAFGQRPGSPASTSSSRTTKWQDYFKVATFPTELLAHTPSSGNIMTLGNPDMRSSLSRSATFDDIAAAAPPKSALSPLPSATAVTSDPAEIAGPGSSTPAGAAPQPQAQGEQEPVKMLLAQLTELHDSLQRDKEVRWNEFLRKVRAERQRAGEAAAEARRDASDTPEAALVDGEVIGTATLGNTGKVGRAKYKEFKALVLGGIPVSLRAKIWAECSGAATLRVPGYYEELADGDGDVDPDTATQIEADIHRTLTDNVFFRRGPGTAKLRQVLRAYARRNPEVGYCQGMNLIVASLLLIMPAAEDAFWVLASAVETILPRHYYDNSLLASRADQQVLRGYVAELLPRLSAHLDALGVQLEALTFQWFLSLFTDCLSAEALYRVWDVLLCTKDEEGHGGSTFLFQVALALLKLNEGALLACAAPAEVYAYLGSSVTNHAISIDGLIGASDGLRAHVRRADVEERRARCVAAELETLRERERIREEVGRKHRGSVSGSKGSAAASGSASISDAKGSGSASVSDAKGSVAGSEEGGRPEAGA